MALLEQGQLSCGTTWHAAGIVGQLRTHPSLTRLMLDSSRLYASLEELTGQGTGWNQSGALWVAASAERLVQLDDGHLPIRRDLSRSRQEAVLRASSSSRSASSGDRRSTIGGIHRAIPAGSIDRSGRRMSRGLARTVATGETQHLQDTAGMARALDRMAKARMK